jgi:hypothetical protein
MNGYDLLKILNNLNTIDGKIKITKNELKEKIGHGESWLMVRVRKLERAGFIDWKSQGREGVAIQILKQPVFESEILSHEWAIDIEKRLRKIEMKMIDENLDTDYKSCWIILKRCLKNPQSSGRITYIGKRSSESLISEMAKIEMQFKI